MARTRRVPLTLMGIATLVISIRDLTRDRRDKQRMAAELAAGRAVQQLLIPESSRNSGLQRESVYKPAGQVGGDFFQMLPLDNKSVACFWSSAMSAGKACPPP